MFAEYGMSLGKCERVIDSACGNLSHQELVHVWGSSSADAKLLGMNVWDNGEGCRWGHCEGDTMTRPLLLSEILWKGKLIGYEHTSRLVQWLSSVYNEQWWYMKGDFTSTVVILRDQTEECPLCQVWSNIPKQSSKLMLKLISNQLNDISSGLVNTTLGWMIQP